MRININNPAVDDLIELGLINLSSSELISKKTRDKNIRVFRDKKSGIIFLEKYTKSDKYYISLNNLDYDRAKKIDIGIQKVRTKNGIIKCSILQDDLRRSSAFKTISKNKNILDFGCGWGGYLSLNKSAKKKYGVELRKECINFIKKNEKKINISDSIDTFQKQFDIISMFHVLEHLPHQIEIIKKLKDRLVSNGKLIIEVPHAGDILLGFEELKKFRDFTFFSEHLILHTKKSLKKLLEHVGFKNIKINYTQRYSFANHLGWFLRGVPNGHSFFNNYSSIELDKSYSNHLKKISKTDTLIAIAEKK